jgi:hypothetical protein
MSGRIIVIARNDNMPRLSGPAPTFDATAEQWVNPPSGMTPDAGAAADLRRHSEHTLSFPPLKTRRLVAGPSATRHSALDAFTVVLGIIVFGAIAYALLVLA